MSRAELLALFEEVSAILESSSTAVEKVALLEELILEPSSNGDDGETDVDEDDDVAEDAED